VFGFVMALRLYFRFLRTILETKILVIITKSVIVFVLPSLHVNFFMTRLYLC
jgi:hypothetical protein